MIKDLKQKALKYHGVKEQVNFKYALLSLSVLKMLYFAFIPEFTDGNEIVLID